MGAGDGKSATIVGAGLAGCLLACYLAREGFRVRVFERRPDPRRAGYTGGRSINLALSARGLWGLEGVGLDREVLEHALPMRGRIMHPADAGKPTYFQPYSRNPNDSIKSISRGQLNLTLLNAAAAQANVEFVFDRRCVDIDLDRCAAVFERDTGDGGQSSAEVIESDVIFGADGAFSAVRARLQKTDRFEYEQTFLSHGYKELHIPAMSKGGEGEDWAMDPGGLHIWPRGSAMMIALPNPDRSFTCTLFWPFEGRHGFGSLKTEGEVVRFFERNYPDAVALMPTLARDYLENPVGSLVTVRCRPWVHECADGRAVAILGDAAHAIVPFFGQGMNAAFEDVRVLDECVRANPGGLVGALREFERRRKPNADAIARMALDNFVEMRDKVGSRVFLQRKRLEHALHAAFPAWLTPKYNLVSFSTVPYTEALRRGARMNRVLRVATLLFGMVVIALLPVGARGVILGELLLLLAFMAWDRGAYRRDIAA